jgi:hypothetical protein|tara:strand:- start:47 stop:598 length:552 start_codon:yes stop_codon:yes gene_type:complete
MKKIFYFLIILSIGCSSKKERIEVKIMECINNTKDENGIKIKESLELYENLLIKENILKNKSANSYRKLLVNFSKEKNIKIKIDENDSLHLKIYKNRYKVSNDVIFQKIFKCYMPLEKDFLKYNQIKINELKVVFLQLSKSNFSQDIEMAKRSLKIITEEDFELEFYKAILLNALIDYNAPPL